MMAREGASKGTEAHGRIIGPEGGGANLRDGFARGTCQKGDAVHIRKLALIGRHAQRGITLGQLHILVAFACGQRQVLGGDIILEINESLVLALHTPQG